MWSLHPPTSSFLHAWDAASLLPAPDILHLTTPGCHLCIDILLCMLTFIRLGKFRLWFKKKRLPGHRTNFQKSIDQNQPALHCKQPFQGTWQSEVELKYNCLSYIHLSGGLRNQALGSWLRFKGACFSITICN